MTLPRLIALAVCGLVALVLPHTVAALPLDLPPKEKMTGEAIEPQSDTPFPTNPFATFDPVADRVEGTVTRRAWRIGASSMTPLQMIRPLRDQITAAGYEIDFECPDIACGGFDFRFALDLIGEPAMHVDLGDFRYLAATDGKSGSAIAVVTSRSSAAGFLHITTVTPGDAAPMPAIGSDMSTQTDTAPPIPAALTGTGRAVLPGLVFATGSSELAEGEFPSLAELADFLRDRPDATVTLVGHTDAVGAPARNLALSRARAQSVMARLVDSYGIPPAQLAADGVGYLMPLAPNDTEAGRRLNRRVEAVLTATR